MRDVLVSFARVEICKQDAMFFPASPTFVIIIISVQVFRHKMDVIDSESNAYYSLGS